MSAPRRVRHSTAILLLVTLSAPATATAQTITPVTSCESLAGIALSETTITGTELVAAGALGPPARGRGAGPAGVQAGGNPFVDLPAFCRVSSTMRTSSESTIRVEVWLPSATWNARFLVNGYAFYGSTMNPATLAGPLRGGYATAITDNGLPLGARPQEADFMRGQPERIKDWADRAWHETVVQAKVLMTAYYGRGPEYTYFNGGGGAGRQGLAAAQRHPEDFDGVVAGGVAADSTHFGLANLWPWLAGRRSEAGALPASKLPMLHEAVVAACDGRDGLRDGLISDPEGCSFDPGVLQCTAGDRDTCLTAGQVETVRLFYAPPTHARTGRRLFGPLMPGSELGWGGFLGDNPNGYSVEFFRELVFEDPDWDPLTLNFDGDVERAEAVHEAINAVDPDLSAFFARGGKLIMWGGWADTAINPAAETDYYRSVVITLGEDAIGNSMRVYMVPMMGHGFGGADAVHAYRLDTQALLERWVEEGVAPNAVTAAHLSRSVEDREVLLCPYPEVAIYNGSGGGTPASSFTCRVPDTGP